MATTPILPLSKASPSKNGVTTPNRLPPELIFRVIQLALAPPSYTHSKESTSSLLSFSLVCRSWRSIAQQELWTHIVLRDSHAVEMFLCAVGEEWVDPMYTKTLRLGEKRETTRPMNGVAALLDRCRRAEELYVTGLSNFVLPWIAHGAALKKVCLTDSRIMGDLSIESIENVESMYLPALRHLYFKGIIMYAANASAFISPSVLPNLSTVDLISVYVKTQTLSQAQDTEPLFGVVDQIKDISFGTYYGLRDVNDFPNVRSLDVSLNRMPPTTESVLAEIQLIPSTIRFLRARSYISDLRNLTSEATWPILVEAATRHMPSLQVFQFGDRVWVKPGSVKVKITLQEGETTEEKFKKYSESFLQEDEAFHPSYDVFRQTVEHFFPGAIENELD
ncbi:hypothetical protein T439DRAFT_355806 [Meredithblackwellia eburnea MCA 4105]